jgi:hypothetical protein
MISLKTPTETTKIKLSRGVVVTVKPATTLLMETARQKVAHDLRAITMAAEAVKKAGGEIENLPDLADPAVQRAEQLLRWTRELAIAAVVAWEGILEECTPENVAALIETHPFGEEFFAAYTDTTTAIEMEKNG